MTAWEAMIVATAARKTIGSRAQPGASRKNGLLLLPALLRMRAPWPM